MASSEIVRAQIKTLSSAISPRPEISDDGLVWGLRSILVHMRKVDGGFELALGEDRERLFAMLSVAGYRPPDISPVFGHLQAASKFWRSGHKALANLRLVFARLPRIDKAVDAYRIALAEYLLDQGIRPQDLLAELDLAAEISSLSKYSPDQPRVPAGNGVESGRWEPWPERHGERGSRTSTIRVSEADEPQDKLGPVEHQLFNEATPQQQLDENHGIGLPSIGGSTVVLPQGIGVGPFAGKSVKAGPSSRPSPLQQSQINAIGQDTGCHTCGTKDPGTSSGNFVGDHQPTTNVNPQGSTQYYFPHCLRCSRVQGGYLKNLKPSNGE